MQHSIQKEKIGVDINTFSREELDKFGEILTINTEKDSIIKAFDKLGKNYNIDVINCFIDIRKKNGSMLLQCLKKMAFVFM